MDGMMERGSHSVVFDAGQLPSGVYFYTLQADGRAVTHKTLLAR